MRQSSFRLGLVVVAAFAVAACDREAAAPATQSTEAATAVVVPAPTDNNPDAWRAYMTQELQPHMDQRRFRRPFSYFIPMVDPAAADAEEQQRQFDAQAEAIENAVGRGIQAGTMLSFAGPDSKALADVLIKAFSFAAPQSLKGVRIVVLARAEERARVEAAIAPSGAEFIWVDMV